MLISVCVGCVRAGTVPHLVRSIQQQSYDRWELLLVLQGDDPDLLGYAERVSRADRSIRCLHLDGFGRSRAFNAGIAQAHGDVVAFTDDDCEADPHWLEVVADCFTRRPEVGIVAGSTLPAPRSGGLSVCPATYVMECVYDPARSHDGAPNGFYWTGANIAARREALEAIGPYDPYLGPGTDFPAAEDTDYGLRAEEQAIIQWTTPRSVVRHTFGVRRGLAAVLAHQRAYAYGSGALGGKLELWRHPLAQKWGGPLPLHRQIRWFLAQPRRYASRQFRQRYVAQAKALYLSRFTLDSRRVSVPLAGTASVAAPDDGGRQPAQA